MTDLPEGTHTVVVVAADRHGLLRGKRVPAARWPEVRDRGLSLASAILQWTARGEVPVDGPPVTADGVPDLRLHPVPGGVRPVPWRSGTALALCEPRGADGGPLPRSPRAALVRVLDRATALGLQVRIGYEVEFRLLDATTLRPVAGGIGCYDVVGHGAYEDVLSSVRDGLGGMGIEVEASGTECAPGQFEVNLRYGEALRSADDGVLFRAAVKELAARHGMVASFMALPWSDEAGSGLHLHHSLWSQGRNLFAGPDGRLSDTGRHYLGGQQAHLAELALLGSPNPNSLKRRRAHSFSPTGNAWGEDNRTVALRVLCGPAAAVRIEQRDAAADANPYLAVAAQVAAGLHGVQDCLEPSPPTTGDAYRSGLGRPLPTDVPAAIAALESSALAKEVFPPELLQALVQGARYEHDLWMREVSDAERRRFLAVL